MAMGEPYAWRRRHRWYTGRDPSVAIACSAAGAGPASRSLSFVILRAQWCTRAFPAFLGLPRSCYSYGHGMLQLRSATRGFQDGDSGLRRRVAVPARLQPWPGPREFVNSFEASARSCGAPSWPCMHFQDRYRYLHLELAIALGYRLRMRTDPERGVCVVGP